MSAGRLKIWNELAGEWEYPPGSPPGGGSIPSGDGPPVTDPTTLDPGTLYIDETTGALYLVVDADGTKIWCLVGGEISGANAFQGVVLGQGVALLATTGDSITAVISDVDAFNGSGNRMEWFQGVADGDQIWRVKIGTAWLAFSVSSGLQVIAADLDLSQFSGNIYSGDTLPTTDPGVNGQWWCDLAADGTIKRSAG